MSDDDEFTGLRRCKFVTGKRAKTTIQKIGLRLRALDLLSRFFDVPGSFTVAT